MSTENPIDKVMEAFEEFKSTNDKRLADLEKKGSADVVTIDKLDRIEKTLAGYEGLNQKLTVATLESKKALDKVDAVEVKLSRMGVGANADPLELKTKVNDWARAVVNAHTMGIINLSVEQKKALDDTAAEYKALAISPDSAGGNLAPIEYVREINKGVTEITPFRSAVRTRTTALKSIQVPKRTGQFAAQWVSEQGGKSETEGLAYGLDEIAAHEIYALIDITNQMLEDSAFDMEAEIRTEAEEQFSVAEGQAFVSGNGIGKMEGILSNPDVGTVQSGNANLITADGIINLQYGVKTAYARRGIFMLNRPTIGSIRKLKDGNGQYLWMPGIANGVPNTINGASYVEAPDMPNIAAGNKPVAFGDFYRGYTLVDRIAMEMLRDPYTQATGGKIRFIFRRRVGGKVTLAEAIKTLTIGAA